MEIIGDCIGDFSAATPPRGCWVRGLSYFYETERQIFVHAGVDEETGKYTALGGVKKKGRAR